ncbi:MAG TPA: sigma-54 dependent transcriptional regulator [Candidatus Eisenbacteria bacterium]|nr:sigma-54 dependent transcriptional regulator [Candidatus Eisenbacteria bacterium]
MNLNVAVIMPAGPERDALVDHVATQKCAVQVADRVEDFLSRGGEEMCSLAILDFGDGSLGSGRSSSFAPPSFAERRDAVRRLKERWPRMQLAAFLDRSNAAEAAEMNELGIRNLFLKPIRFDAVDGLLKAAGKSAVQQAREQRESSRVREEFRFDRILGQSPALRHAIELAQSVSLSSATSVLILGESGVGKELFARAIHGESPRAKGPFLEINCAAIPRELLESELFGHERGAFTDASSQRIGLFEAGEGGSVFLDEVGELPLTLQAKLLKFLDMKIVRRVGGTRDIAVDVRILAATNRDLSGEVRQGRFREDLFYRLSVVPITVPPLRDRGADVTLLAESFCERVARKLGRTARLSPAAERELMRYPWPGNVRELGNAIERAVLLAKSEEIGPSELALPRVGGAAGSEAPNLNDLGLRFPADGLSLVALEKAAIEGALARTGGNVVEAAKLLHVGRGSLRCKMRRHKIDRTEPRPAPVSQGSPALARI